MEDNALHILMHYEVFYGEKALLVHKGDSFEPSDLVSLRLESSDHWEAVRNFAEAVLVEKESVKRQHQFLDVEGVRLQVAGG